MSAQAEALYSAMCEYLTANGWHREEPGSGWWFHERERLGDEEMIGGAVEQQLDWDGVDLRSEPAPAGRRKETG